MGGWIRRGWIWRFWGTPIFRPEVLKPSSGLKIGASKTRNPTTTDPTPYSRPSEEWGLPSLDIRNSPRAPRMAFPLRGRSSWNFGVINRLLIRRLAHQPSSALHMTLELVRQAQSMQHLLGSDFLGRHRKGRREGVKLLKGLHRLLKNPPPPLLRSDPPLLKKRPTSCSPC